MPRATSYSAFTDWLTCAKKYQLKRVRRAPQLPSFAMVGGSAVHATCDRFDLDTECSDHRGFDFTTAFDEEFHRLVDSEERKSGVPVEHWSITGRPSKDWPQGRNRDFWLTRGPEMARGYAKWREANPHWRLWNDPRDSSPAVEMNLQGVDIAGVKLYMKIDRVFVNGDNLVVVDLKTGTRSPAWLLQLGLYAAGLESATGYRPGYGTFYMAEKGTINVPVSLSQYEPDYIAAMVKQFQTAIDKGVFPPHVQEMCRTCEVRHACYAIGGKNSHLYDDLDPNNRENT